jgi:uncharacterized protein
MARPATFHPSIEVVPRALARRDSLVKRVVPSGAALFRVSCTVFAIALVIGLSLGSFSEQGAAQMRRETLILKTAGGDKTIDIELADTPDQKAMGLMYRTALADTAGMLFPYVPPTEITMWMKNTYISLDMVFIKSDGTVHRVEARTEPLSEKVIASGGACAAVLELAGGAAERLGIKAGDRVLHALFAPKK